MRILLRLTVVVAIIGWGIYYRWLSPERQLQRAADALKRVSSLRYAAVETFPRQRNELGGDLVCGSTPVYDARRHEITEPEEPGGGTLEFVYVGNLSYTRRPDGGWGGLAPAVDDGAEATCRRLAAGAPVWFLPDYEKLLSNGEIEKGPKKEISGVPCREWKITVEITPDQHEYTTTCLRLDDNLPLEMTFRNQVFTYSDYNQPIDIEVPSTPGTGSK